MHLLQLPVEVIAHVLLPLATTDQRSTVSFLSTCQSLFTNDFLWLQLVYLHTDSAKRVLFPFSNKSSSIELATALSKMRTSGVFVADRTRRIEAAVARGQLVSRLVLEGDDRGFASTAAFDSAAAIGALDVLDLFVGVGCVGSSEALDLAAANNELETVKWLHARGCSATHRAMDNAAGNGHLEMLVFLHTERLEGCTHRAMDYAAKNNHLDILQFLYSNRSEGCSPWALEAAASNGHIETVQWLLDQNIPSLQTKIAMKAALDGAAANGFLDTVKLLHSFPLSSASTWAVDRAAGNGHLEVVQWLLENRCESSTVSAMDMAAGCGHLHIIDWLHENTRVGYSSRLICSAAQGNHIAVLQWLLSKNVDLTLHTSETLELASKSGATEAMLFILERYPKTRITAKTALNAFKNNMQSIFLHIFQLFHDQQSPDSQSLYTELWNLSGEIGSLSQFQLLETLDISSYLQTSEIIQKAAEYGHLQLLHHLLRSYKLPILPLAFTLACAGGHLKVATLLYAYTSPITLETYSASITSAAQEGHHRILAWLNTHCRPASYTENSISVRAMNTAAGNGHLECVEYLHIHCSVSESCTTWAMDRAAMNNHFHVIKWLTRNRSEGCSQWALNDAAKYGYLHICEYLVANWRLRCDGVAFRYAVEAGKIDVVRFLWKEGIIWEGEKGRLVDLAVKKGHWKVRQFLVEKGF
ncbi:ankyrin [Rhizoclosmatium globosum]|uniref:Ankyrin n=1 Tax=Rhizoclosmatium globosum TaxID=329046 RepID=A0A1Y2C4I6_9FUNG|nr:ankyrin [Rhizoclosmatium globosum]|eukprot:ORY41950.1 ankyrin [Rhizoclosmatium globosum]